MRVVMLGWEYPPHISGGLGTACEGLTNSLARLGTEIVFVVPHLFGGERAPHMRMVDSSRIVTTEESSSYRDVLSHIPGLEGSIQTVSIPSFLRPYLDAESFGDFVEHYRSLAQKRSKPFDLEKFLERKEIFEELAVEEGIAANRYSGDMFEEVSRYTSNVIALLSGSVFDVIHAHDWMTFPAGVALSRLSGKPLVVHVHSLEFDRSGGGMNPRIAEIERFGLEQAARVVAVSYYTKSIITQQQKIDEGKITVVHNGVYPKHVVQNYRSDQRKHQKIVLFLGRVTFQKGPDYFVEAAAKVIPTVPDAVFVMAGAGDMLPRMKRRVEELGIADHFLFTGFLKGEEVEEVFSTADLYVMPSVSEPFGISALEAISFETPVLISRQSGVAEVLSHALKVDFWDVDRMSDLIINALVHEELRADMVSMAREEVKRVHWDAAAYKVSQVYRDLQKQRN